MARKVAFHEDEIGRAAAAAAAAEVQRTPYVPTPSGGESAAAGEEQTHALRSMSGVLIKEWSAFVLKEVRARKEVEQQMLELREEMRAMLEGFRGEVRATRQEWIGDASFYGANVRDAREAAAAQRRKVARMARATFSRRRTCDAFATWRVAAFQKRRRRVAMRRAAGRLTHTRLAKATAAWRQRARARRVEARRRAGRPRRRRRRDAARARRLAARDAGGRGREAARATRGGASETRGGEDASGVGVARRGGVARADARAEAAAGILRKTHARWTRAATADTFYAWLSVASGKRRRRARLSQLVLRVLNRERHAAFLAWARARVRREGNDMSCPC